MTSSCRKRTWSSSHVPPPITLQAHNRTTREMDWYSRSSRTTKETTMIFLMYIYSTTPYSACQTTVSTNPSHSSPSLSISSPIAFLHWKHQTSISHPVIYSLDPPLEYPSQETSHSQFQQSKYINI